MMEDGRRAKPLGVIQNMKIEVKNNVIPVDVFILNKDEVKVEDIILGRPFLRLVQALLDAEKGHLRLTLGGQEVLFVFKDPPKSNDPPSLQEFFPVKEDKFDAAYTDQLNKLFEESDLSKEDEEDTCADRQESGADRHNAEKLEFEPMGYLDPEEAPEVEHKQLPNSLRYEYLGKIKCFLLLLRVH